MANVMFKRGTQAALANVTPQDGVFYLTEDTNRLYVGQRSSTAANAEIKLVELNKSITNVSQIQSDGQGGYTVTDPVSGIRPVEPGEFYYYGGTTASPANILMIGQAGGKLLQINQDTDIHLDSGTITFHTPASGTAIQLITKLYNTLPSGASQSTTAAVDRTVAFAAGDRIGLSATDSTLTISADASVLSAATATTGINLSVDGTTAVNVYGDGGTSVTLDANGKIKITSGDTNGFTYTLSGYTNGANVSTNTANNSKGRRKINLTNGSGTSSSDVYLPIPQIKLGGNTTDTSTTFVAAVDNEGYDVIEIPVYSKKEIEEKLSGITSPLNYKGSTASLPSSGQANGDVYLLSADSATPAAKIGDLAVWNSSLNDGAGGWDIIPSGNDQMISATVAGGMLKFSDTLAGSTTGNLATIGYDNTQDSDKTKVQFASSGVNTKNYTLSASLPEYYATAPTAVAATSGTATYGGSVIIPSVTVDKYGRVTELSASNLTLPAAQTISGSVLVDGNGDHTFSIALSNGSTATFYSKTLTVSAIGTDSNRKNYIDLTWGEF